MARNFWLGLVSCELILLVAACGSAKPPTTKAPDPVFPASVYSNEAALKAYQIAVGIPDTLEVLPCYCGCVSSLQHRNLKDCFINPDGSFDEHATTCAVCDMQAADAATWQAKGNPPWQIWRLMVTKYDSYGPGTDTPQPAK